MNSIFINEAFDTAIKDYIKINKNYDEIIANSFLVMVLKMLAYIYGEVDIINPYIIHSEKAFSDNIRRYGLSSEKYMNFIDNFKKYYLIECENQKSNVKKINPYFVLVQKDIIDMFFIKKSNYHITSVEEKEFFDLLYTSKTTHLLRSSYNYLTTKNIREVEEYYKECYEESLIKKEKKKADVLNIEAYELLNYSLTDIANMDAEKVEKINEHVYEFFDIDSDSADKKDLLNSAIANYKKYNTRLTTGNGYVDILLIIAVIVTVIMILAVITFVVL